MFGETYKQIQKRKHPFTSLADYGMCKVCKSAQTFYRSMDKTTLVTLAIRASAYDQLIKGQLCSCKLSQTILILKHTNAATKCPSAKFQNVLSIYYHIENSKTRGKHSVDPYEVVHYEPPQFGSMLFAMRISTASTRSGLCPFLLSVGLGLKAILSMFPSLISQLTLYLQHLNRMHNVSYQYSVIIV